MLSKTASGLQPKSGSDKKWGTEYQKQVATKLLDALDEGSLWHLAHVLECRGLIRTKPGGLEVVAKEAEPLTPGPVNTGLGGASSIRPGAATVNAAATNVEHKILLDVALATTPPAAEPKAAQAKPGTAPFSQGTPSYLPTSATRPEVVMATEGPIGAAPKHTHSVYDHSNSQEGSEKAEDDSATTLILRNMPSDFDQQMTEEWVNERGFQGLYDFLLWFPAKRTTRLNASSYAFVNFRYAEDARRFRRENHLTRLCAGKWALSIAIAKVQGFAENYIRFHHLTGDSSPTLCQPFFSQDAINKLSDDAHTAAASAAKTAPQTETLQEGPCTTLIIRNMPYAVDNQENAREWLNDAGFEGTYDFFLYLPAKRRRPEPPVAGGPPQGLAYAFVNFLSSDSALTCIDRLNGKALNEGDPVLNVVAARVQGLDECLRHFSNIGDNGRVIPWVGQGVDYEPPPRQYQ